MSRTEKYNRFLELLDLIESFLDQLLQEGEREPIGDNLSILVSELSSLVNGLELTIDDPAFLREKQVTGKINSVLTVYQELSGYDGYLH